ncbi:hypothetical protein IAR50_006152 [Cryptococcus sp. DSM 104548]
MDHHPYHPPPYSEQPLPSTELILLSPRPTLTPHATRATHAQQLFLQRALQDYNRSSNPSHWGLYRHGLLIHTLDEDEEGWLLWVLRLFGEAIAPPFDGPAGGASGVVGYRSSGGGGMGMPVGFGM